MRDPTRISAKGAAARADDSGVSVSILIAAGDGVAATMRCLSSIARTVGEDVPFEVVLVDDATSDGTAAALAGVEGDFRVLRNDVPRGVKAAWAQAAAEARGEHLVLMRHEAAARDGWVPALLAALAGDGAPAVVRARTLARGPVGGVPACLAMRAQRLRARSGAARAEAIERACVAAVEVPEAVVELDGAGDPGSAPPPAPLPMLRDVGGLGTFLATRLGGRHGDVLFCSDAQRALEDTAPSTALALVLGEIPPPMLERIAASSGLRRTLGGLTVSPGGTPDEPLSILDRWAPVPAPAAPDGFTVFAVVTSYNEADIILQTIGRLVAVGVEVHLLDNWSSDGTFELVGEAFGERVGRERFPHDGPSPTYDWAAILDRVESITRERPCDWAIHQDADKVRESPWPGIGLRDALYHVRRAGFNCVDHTVLNFRPVDDAFVDGADLDESFPWCEFPVHQSDFMQLKAWSASDAPVGLAIDGGHQVRFPGRRIFPYKFLLRHYPIRSQRHGERKVLRDRKTRWNAAERARGWHVHYDAYDERSSFLWDPRLLLRFDDPRFMAEHLIERISGVGLCGSEPAANAQIQAALLAA